jgi:hypothetical protein
MYPLDPPDLPYVNATVERFVLNPCGAADGMILSNGLGARIPGPPSSVSASRLARS